MPSVPSVHDNHIRGYAVAAADRRIVIETEYPHCEPPSRIDIIFDEVLAYHFRHDVFGAIIFDVEEIDLGALLKKHAGMFEEGWRHGWPRGWDKRKEDLASYVSRMAMRAFELSSSYGMDGWVIAQRMTLHEQKANKVPEPTPPLVTPRADARVAPSGGVAHL